MNNRDEQISALLDNALDHQELDAFLQDLKRDPVDDAERIQRYRMVADVMRNELNMASFMDISSAVQRAIENEPDIALNAARAPRRSFDFSAWLRPLSGVAIAASVAMVTVVSFRAVETPSDTHLLQTVAGVAPASSQVIAPVNPQIRQQIQVVSTKPGTVNTMTQQQLNDYLMNHSEYAGQTTIQGMMPYARVISLDDTSRQ